MSRPPPSRFTPQTPQYKINGKIRAREVRVIGADGQQVGVLDLGAAINLARTQNLDLVEIAPTAVPPVCRIVDFGKFKYEQAKRDRDAKKHQHANQVKEVQLTPRISPHDLAIKLEHAVEFLCEDMKVKIALRFRGREMAHTEIGMAVVDKFLKDVAPWGHPDSPPRLVGKAVNVMISPLPRARRAKNPKETGESLSVQHEGDEAPQISAIRPPSEPSNGPVRIPVNGAETGGGFGHNPFSKLDLSQR